MPEYMEPGQYPYDIVRLSTSTNSYLFPVTAVRYQNLASFSRKSVIGDYTRDSDDLISTYIALRNVTGGGQIYDINEASDVNRFWYATLRTTESNYISLNRETVDVEGAYVLGDLNATDRFYYANADLNIFVWEETTDSGTDTTANLTAIPVNVAVNFKGSGTNSFFVPLGASGIDKFDGTTVTNIPGIPAAAMYAWSNKVYALGTDGVLYSSLDGTTFAQEGFESTVDGSERAKNLASFYNRSDRLVLYAITNRAAYAYDEDVEKFYETDMNFPPHPGNSKGACRWRDQLNAASGMMVYSYNGGVVSEFGPARNDGLPAAYRGTVVDLRPGHNALYALIQGSTDTGDVPADVMDPTSISDTGITFSGATAVSSVMAWTQLGWHTIWVSPTSGVAPNRIVVSGAQDDYRLWWDAGGALHTQCLEIDFHNPLQGINAGVDRFAPDGYIETGWFDAAMEGFHKLASHLEVSLERADPTYPVTVKYQSDSDNGWTILGTDLAAKGKHVLPFGLDDNGFSRGLHFERIRFRLEMRSTDAMQSPLLRHIGLYFIKEPKESAAWTMQVDLSEEGAAFCGWADTLTLKQTLDDLLEAKEFLVLEHLREQLRVRIAAVPNGEDSTGQDVYSGSRVISIVEVKLGESELEVG